MAVPESLKNKFWASLVGRTAELDVALRRASEGDAEALGSLCAALHKIKGEAQLLGLVTCAELAQKMEAIAKARGSEGLRSEDAEPLVAGVLAMREMGTNAGQSASFEEALTGLILHGRALRAAGGAS